MASTPVSRLTGKEYLALERAAEFKSEFLYGEMIAMAGASTLHCLIQGNLFGELFIALRGGECRPFGSDIRVMLSNDAYVYPDVTVVCGKQQHTGEQRDNLINPVAIFEVLSPSTEKYDRGVKSRLYRTIDSLQDYILVSQDEVHIEQFARRDGVWTLRDYESLSDVLKLDSIGVAIPLARIYDQVEMADGV